MATVRGIGVAVMTSTCGAVPLARSASRCSTPKRCCSSMTTRPRSLNSTPSLSSAWVPTTMPASPSRCLSQRGPARGGAERAGQQRDPGRLVRAAELAATRQRTEQLTQRPGVLLGEHLGRGEQCRLAAAVDDGEHRPQRDDGLATADLALQQPVHRLGPGQLVVDDLADLVLAGRQDPGQGGVEQVEQAAVPTAAAPCRLAPCARGAGGQARPAGRTTRPSGAGPGRARRRRGCGGGGSPRAPPAAPSGGARGAAPGAAGPRRAPHRAAPRRRPCGSTSCRCPRPPGRSG